MSERFTVESWNAGIRLDRFLVAMTKQSRNHVQQLIEDDRVFVNGKTENKHHAVREKDIIEILPATPSPSPDSNLSNLPRRQAGLQPLIIDETDNYLVIEKPSGLLVHPNAPLSEDDNEPTLVDWLRKKVRNIDSVGELHRPGLVHRLDREVSGLMVIAKTPQSYEHLKEQFKKRQIMKVYTALVAGGPADDDGTISFRIARSKRTPRRMAARPESADGKEAVTKYDVLQRFKNATLLSVRILTGRTHQIRTHLFAKGWPVVGDTLYTHKDAPKLPPLSRPFLHASKLGFEDMQKQWKEYENELPEELQNYLKTLR